MNKVTDILSFVNKHDIKFVKVSIIDLLGQKRSVELPISCLADVRNNHLKCDSSSILGGKSVHNSDMNIKIDESSSSLSSDCTLEIYGSLVESDGTPYELDSRYILEKQLQIFKNRGYFLNVGLEPEFYLVDQEKLEPIDALSYFSLEEDDLSALIRRKAALALLNEGYVIGPYHHEVGPGQCEINFSYADALNAADRLYRYKEIIKSVARSEGCRATFLPKPFSDLPGSGMHLNCSISDEQGKNLIYNPYDEKGISPLANRFISGILYHSKAITAFACTISNSYLRLHSNLEAPGDINFSYNDRTAAIRIPEASVDKKRFEIRYVDNTANLYLLLSSIIVAGLDGIDHPNRLFDNKKKEELPHTLEEALFELSNDELISSSLGKDLIDRYTKIKKEENYDIPMSVAIKRY